MIRQYNNRVDRERVPSARVTERGAQQADVLGKKT
jgi:hypothetical protein